jgi:hypothetical protein
MILKLAGLLRHYQKSSFAVWVLFIGFDDFGCNSVAFVAAWDAPLEVSSSGRSTGDPIAGQFVPGGGEICFRQ